MRDKVYSCKSQNRVSSFIGLAVLLLATLCCAECERDTEISVSGGNPPTFELSGNGNLAFLAVSDDSPNKVENRSGEFLWKIIPQSGKSYVGKLPPITYGQLPPGFTQEIPANGTPPPLIENRYYQVSAPTSNADGDWVYIIIRNGKAEMIKKTQHSFGGRHNNSFNRSAIEHVSHRQLESIGGSPRPVNSSVRRLKVNNSSQSHFLGTIAAASRLLFYGS
jgi:hypothetical protein